MKKILPTLMLTAILFAFVVPVMVSGQAGPQECCKLRKAIKLEGTTYSKDTVVGPMTGTTCVINGVDTTVTQATEQWGALCILNVVNSITDWLFIIIVAIVVIFVLIGGFAILTSAGDPAKVTKGQNYLIYAAVGMGVALLARAVPALVLLIMQAG